MPTDPKVIKKLEYIFDHRTEVYDSFMTAFRDLDNREKNEKEYLELSKKLGKAIPKLLGGYRSIPAIIALTRILDILAADSLNDEILDDDDSCFPVNIEIIN